MSGPRRIRGPLALVAGMLGLAAPNVAAASGITSGVRADALNRGVPTLSSGVQLGISPVPGTPRSAEADDATAPASAAAAGAGPATVSAEAEEAEPRLLEKRNVLPFWLDRTTDTHRTKALLLPPLFVHREGNAEHPDKFMHFDASLTTGWYDKKKEKRRWFAPLALWGGSWDDHKVTWGGALPIPMGYKRLGEKYNFGAFPLAWAWGNRHQKNLLLIPFHFQSKSDRSFTGISSFLFWYGRADLDDDDLANDRKHFIAFPLLWSFKRGQSSFMGSPVYFAGANAETGLKHRTLAPFFHWQSREFGNQTELWTPFFIKRRDRARRKGAWGIPLLASFGVRNDNRRLSMFTPLLWRTRDTLAQRDTWIAGPIGVHRDRSQRASWVAPLWFRFASLDGHGERRSSATGLVPLFFARDDGERASVHTILGYGSRSRENRDWGLGLHPLLTYAGRKNDRSHMVALGGTFWRMRDRAEQRDGWGVGPLVYRTRAPDRASFGLPALLTFSERRGDRLTQTFTPLVWHRKDPAAERNLWVFGPGYLDTGAGSKRMSAGLAPLVFAGKTESRSHVVIPPLLTWHRRDREAGTRETVSPVFVRSEAPGRRATGILALGWDVAREGERHTVVAPVYYRRRMGDTTWTLTPVGGGKRTPDGRGWAYGPVYGFDRPARERRGGGFAPLVWHVERTAEHEAGSTTVVPGLFIRDRRPERDLDVWSPLVWRSKVRGELPRENLAIAPLYFRQRQVGGTNVDAGLGFFWSRNATRRTHTLVAGPFYHKLTRKAVHTGVFPVSWWMDSEEHRRLISLPIIFQDLDKTTGKMTTLAVPFWFDRRLQNGRRTWMAFPFAVGRRGQYDFTRVSLAPPGYFDIFRLQKNMRFTGFVPLAFRYQKGGFKLGEAASKRYTLWGSFPLFFYGKDGEGRRTHSALGLYWADRDAGGRKFFTLLGGGEYRPGERTRWYAGPLYRDVTQTHATSAFLPLFYMKKHRALNRRTLLVAPPLFIERRRDDRRWFEAGLLVWQVRTPAKVTTVVLPPIFGLQHAYAERKLSWLAPLYLHDANTGNDESWTAVFPALALHHQSGARSQFIQFPLVWHFGRKDGHGTVGFPLWWDFRNKDRRTQIVPGIWARHDKGNSRLNVVGPLLAHWKTARDGSEKHWRVLFGLFGGGRVGDQRYAHVLGGVIPVGGKKAEDPVASTRAERRAARRDARKALAARARTGGLGRN